MCVFCICDDVTQVLLGGGRTRHRRRGREKGLRHTSFPTSLYQIPGKKILLASSSRTQLITFFFKSDVLVVDVVVGGGKQ